MKTTLNAAYYYKVPTLAERKQVKLKLIDALYEAAVEIFPEADSAYTVLHHGVCNVIDVVLMKEQYPGRNLLGYYVSSARAKRFPGFSGNTCFPVKSPDHLSPEAAYFACCGSQWVGTYGTNRKAYASWLAGRLRQEYDSGNYSLLNPRIR